MLIEIGWGYCVLQVQRPRVTWRLSAGNARLPKDTQYWTTAFRTQCAGSFRQETL